MERLGYEDISRGFLPTNVQLDSIGAVSRLLDQMDVCRNDQLFRVMQTGLICLHDDEIVSERLAHMLQKQIHRSRVGSWQDQRKKQSLGRSNGGKDIH